MNPIQTLSPSLTAQSYSPQLHSFSEVKAIIPKARTLPTKAMSASCCAALPCQLQMQPTAAAPLWDALIHLKARMRTSRARQEPQYTATAAEWQKSFGKSQPLPAGGPQNWSEALPHPFQGCQGVSRQQVTQTLTGSAQDMTHPHQNERFPLGKALGSG